MDENLKKKIIEDFGLTNIDIESQTEMIDKIGTLLFEAVVERALDMMEDSILKEFETCIDQNEQDFGQVVAFLRDRVPGFKEIVSEELNRLRRTTSSIFA